jgi:hypothetical protein
MAASSQGVMIGVYLAVAAAGYACGARGYFPFGESAHAARSTPLARVGFALREEKPAAAPEAWAALRDDVEVVRSSWNAPEPAVFDLIVALRGLGNGGNSEWARAEQICRELKWARCDRAALEQLKERALP